MIPYILFLTSQTYTGDLNRVAYFACNQTAANLLFTNGKTFPFLPGFNQTYDPTRSFVGPTGIEIAQNISILRNSSLEHSFWEAKSGCNSPSTVFWTGTDSTGNPIVNINESEDPAPHCDGYYSNFTRIKPFLPWTSAHPFDGSSAAFCDSKTSDWEVSASGKTCDNSLQFLCVFDPNPAQLSMSKIHISGTIGSRAKTNNQCKQVCPSSIKTIALLYYSDEGISQFPQELLYKHGLTGTTSIVKEANKRIELFRSWREVNTNGIIDHLTPSFFTGEPGRNCLDFTDRTLCLTTSINLGSNMTVCGDIVPDIICLCYNKE